MAGGGCRTGEGRTRAGAAPGGDQPPVRRRCVPRPSRRVGASHLMRRRAGIALFVALAVGACTVSVDDGDDAGDGLEDPGDCIPVDMAVSPEKLELLTDLAN